MRRFVLVVALLPIMGILALLQGCNEQTASCPEVSSAVPEVDYSGSTSGDKEAYGCNSARAGLLEQTWCEAKSKFAASSNAGNMDAFNAYLKDYRSGVNDARQGKESRAEMSGNIGYVGGYATVKSSLGVVEYDCGATDKSSEFKERWCEASSSFRSSNIGGDSFFVKGRYIDGYMAGGNIALTIPNSMDSIFGGGDSPEENKQPSVVRPAGELQGAELAFYQGFDEGYKAMIASVRESINQVMEQMQPNGMELPEGMMLPQPGQ